MRGYFGFMGGRPPRNPLSRAAVAFASDRALPPFRPRETAAGFLRGTEGALVRALRFVGVVMGEAPWGLAWNVGRGWLIAVRTTGRGGRFLWRHTTTIPNRLGSVKWGVL